MLMSPQILDRLPWWAFFTALVLAAIFVLPTCMILAISNIGLALNVISPFIAGYMIPGRPIGVMIFKVFSTITLGQAQSMCSCRDLHLYASFLEGTETTSV
jgi:glucan phosphoethanolaminetransferase (alkaline phosphatase superfamily)